MLNARPPACGWDPALFDHWVRAVYVVQHYGFYGPNVAFRFLTCRTWRPWDALLWDNRFSAKTPRMERNADRALPRPAAQRPAWRWWLTRPTVDRWWIRPALYTGGQHG